ncbi:MAG: DEAD/DEAH box helicase [Promethearchaeota archaeon]
MRTSIEMFLKELKNAPDYEGQLAHIEKLPRTDPKYGSLDIPLILPLQRFLDKKNLRLYTHQAEAINEIRRGNDIIITTPTASGKTLAYALPIFEELWKDKTATALFLYPTKALSNDQLKVLVQLERETDIKVNASVYDGDTPTHARPKIRQKSRMILSNPYAIHQYIPWHSKWKRFFQGLKFIVIDEAHTYRGVFGANCAFLFRRLLRICDYYGASPRFILSSATVANPEEQAYNLTGKKSSVISVDGSSRGRKFFVFWNPPYSDEAKCIRRSTHQETMFLLAESVKSGIQTLCFTISRQMAELIARWTRETLSEEYPEYIDRVSPYRAGYLPEERRQIEQRLKNNELLGVTSTTALEVGIDIGSLDEVIISGYPGTLISTWQQAGRAGRGMDDSLVMLVPFSNPLDQFFMKHPEKFFGTSPEHAVIDLKNPYVVLGHLMCASAELPINLDEERYFGTRFKESLDALQRHHLVRQTPRGYVYSGKIRATEVVNLNNISNKIVSVHHEGRLLETMDLPQAYREAHKGAILLHQGETYIVENLDIEKMIASVQKEEVELYTNPLNITDITVLRVTDEKEISSDFKLKVADVEVTEFYHSYMIKRYDVVIGRRPIDLPPLKFQTVAVYFTIPEWIEQKVNDSAYDLNFEGALHACEHAMIAMAPMFALCDRWDIGGVSIPYHADEKQATIFIYDSYEFGIGIAEKIYELFESGFLQTTFEMIRDCECEDGCPACIYSPKCGNNNEPLDKKGALLILEELLKLL